MQSSYAINLSKQELEDLTGLFDINTNVNFELIKHI